jgi:hypothetical protein
MDRPAALLQYCHEAAYEVVEQHSGSSTAGEEVRVIVGVGEGADELAAVGMEGAAVGGSVGAVGLEVGVADGRVGAEVGAGPAANPLGLMHSADVCEGCTHCL